MGKVPLDLWCVSLTGAKVWHSTQGHDFTRAKCLSAKHAAGLADNSTVLTDVNIKKDFYGQRSERRRLWFRNLRH